MANVHTGNQAEAEAAAYLESEGYEIVARNWRTRYCEIDIIARKDKRIYLVEVKYRKSDFQGSGLEYITAQKLRQMHFAAEMWVADQRWPGEYQLAAVEVSGPEFRVTNFVEDVS
jgi:uncharacterized protein (TIGR00252 family)